MNEYFSPCPLTAADFRGQFVLTRRAAGVPAGWKTAMAHGWTLGTMDLPVTPVFDPANNPLGWCLGHPVFEGTLLPARIVIDPRHGDGLDDFYLRAASRYLLVLFSSETPRLYLDAHGSLSAVYSPQSETVASTTTLIDAAWDEELIQQLEFPQSQRAWAPGGLTFKRGVHRLQANHALDTGDWTARRHWPGPGALDIDDDTNAGVNAVVQAGRETISAIASVHPLHLSLTAGRDSRMLLACARPFLGRIEFFTFVEQGMASKNTDAHTARRLAVAHGLSAKTLVTERAGPDELRRWQQVTGHALSSSIWNVHPTLRKLDSARVVLPGMAGEVGRAFYWKADDGPETKLNPEAILGRLSKPKTKRLLLCMEEWLSGLRHLNALQILDLLYIEQRLSCWAGPQHYGNQHSLFEAVPLSSRRAFTAMMRLPYRYRFEQRLASDVCRAAWPELLELPFNERTGLKWRAGRAAARVRAGMRSLLGTPSQQDSGA